VASPRSRRTENAEQTRQAILDAARDLFIRHGYFQTTVGEIAAAARVSVAWVHATAGGKAGLMRTLIENGVTTADNTAALSRMTTITEPAELLRFLVHATGIRFAEWSGLMRQVAAAAAKDPGVREIQEIAHEGLRSALVLTADRLDEMGALRVTPDRAAGILWFFLSNTAYFMRTDELGWPLAETEEWLVETLSLTLLR
jgi:AcrR family transcriptional regulator